MTRTEIRNGGARVAEGRQRFLSWSVGMLLLAAPLYWASVLPLPRMFLELGAVFILLVLFWPKFAWDGERFPEAGAKTALALLTLYPLLYLLPLPASLASLMPGAGRDPYHQAAALLAEQRTGWSTLTVVPTSTEIYWLAFLPPLAAFLGTIALHEGRRIQLAYLAVGMAVFEALLGLMQYGAPRDSLLCFGADICGSNARGTYYNYDHLAGLLEMLLPFSVGLIAASIGRSARVLRYRQSWREQLGFWISWQGHAAALLTAGGIAMLLGLIFTRSRSGIAIIMLGIVVCLIVFGRRLGAVNKASELIGTIVVVVLGLALDIGLAPILKRFSFEDPLHDSRMTIYFHTLEGIGKFMPFGSGPGTFPEVFRQFQPAKLGDHFVNHAHNDYLEWVFEGGLAGGALLVLLIVVYLRQWLKLAGGRHHHSFRYLQLGAGAGLLLLLLHGLVDFNWHIPANALYAAFLAGIFMSRAERKIDKHGESREVGPTDHEAAVEPPRRYVLAKPAAPVRNPFDDPDPGETR